MLLNQIAWFLVDAPEVKNRDLTLAKAIAAQAVAAAPSDGSILDTLARVHWEMGDKAKAIELQVKAAELAKGTPMEEDVKKTLEKYQSAK
jgi:hypothetical protein